MSKKPKFLVICSDLLKKSLNENFIFCATNYEISMSLDILMTKNFYKKIPKKDSESNVQVSA